MKNENKKTEGTRRNLPVKDRMLKCGDLVRGTPAKDFHTAALGDGKPKHTRD